MRTYEHIGLAVSEVLLPREGVDPQQWAVVACDQYTSEPEYWERVSALVGDAPSTLHMIFPEVFLEDPVPDAMSEQERIERIRAAMGTYLDDGVLRGREAMVYLERTVDRKVRRGLVVCVDLEAYDYTAGSTSLIRATEGTIVERLPPRIAVRAGAALELPHIMVLIDDPEDTVIGALAASRDTLDPAYDVELMEGGGHLTGLFVTENAEQGVVSALAALGTADAFAARYGLAAEQAVLLYAMGDGNHSLATAKAIWEKSKEDASDPVAVMDSTTRYALVELVNVHDAALEFEPIHRVLFELDSDRDVMDALRDALGDRLHVDDVPNADEMVRRVDVVKEGVHRVGLVRPGGWSVLTVDGPTANLAVGTLQAVLDPFMASGGADRIDYVHGTDVVCALGAQQGNVGFYLPAMRKDELFRTVILDGALPRKTFSMGEAHEKRFYMECRRLD